MSDRGKLAAAERQRLRRERRDAGILVHQIELSEDLADFAVAAQIIDEGVAATPEGRAEAAKAILDSVVSAWLSEKATGSDCFSPSWAISSAEGAPLTPAEKRAWVKSHGLQNATRHELQEAIKAAGLLHRWG